MELRSLKSFWLLGIAIHILLFLFVIDLYFKSPIRHGMPVHKTRGEPFAKRIVIFVADGLRAEAIYPDNHQNRMEYLKNLRASGKSAWGVAHTGVPTESRPGHVAIFAGLYEDPSAIFTGWQKNTVEFDSVINESNYAWSLGSPDIVNIFTKHDESRLFVDHYEPDDEDFSGKSSTLNLDKWVFDQIPQLLSIKDKNSNKLSKESLIKDGNIFFLHLLGMDTVGHVHKPESRQYVTNLKFLDKGVKDTVLLFESFFNDDKTAYLMTSDHGMTNWGSHGDGTEHETEVPYVLWGSGVNCSQSRRDVKHVDIAPLISSIIGVPVPQNSYGILPYYLLKGSNLQIAEALFANVKQHYEQYKFLRDEFQSDPYFKEYRIFRGHSVLENAIESLDKAVKVGDSFNETVKAATTLMEDMIAGNKYLRDYYYLPKIMCIIAGFIFWFLYLTISVQAKDKMNVSPYIGVEENVRFFQLFSLLFITVIMARANANVFTYLYPLFPILCSLLITEDSVIFKHLFKLPLLHNLKKVIVFGLLVEALVLGFFMRLFCSVIMLYFAVWIIHNARYEPTENRFRCLIGFTSLAFLQQTEPSTTFSLFGLLLGTALWYLIFQWQIRKNIDRYLELEFEAVKGTTRMFLTLPIAAYTIACLNALWIAYDFTRGSECSDYNRIVSWIITGACLLLIPLSPKTISIRFGQIAGCLIIPYTLMAMNKDLVFYALLVFSLFYWIRLESRVSDSAFSSVEYEYSATYGRRLLKIFDHYRLAFTYLAMIVCYFFAIGNLASFNGFDPLWTKAYVTTFNPILMCILIVFKMAIPFFLITCALNAVIFFTNADSTVLFKIIILFLDQMVLNFTFFIRNEGSWKEIGKSVSHFVVMEAFALIILIFYVVAKYVCCTRWTL